jgi:hypothetical protein
MSMDVSERLNDRFQQLRRTPALLAPALSGVAAATACAQVLPVAGIGLALLQPPLRAPIGASSSDAVNAERLQFTVGDGPCLLAHHTQRIVMATTEVMSRQWPVMAAQLSDQTPYRAVLGAPLTGWLAGLGTMDVYFTDDNTMNQLDRDHLSAALDTVGTILASALGDQPANAPGDQPQTLAFLDVSANNARHKVVVATGILVAELTLPFHDALDTLRGYAFRTGRDIDSVSSDLVEQTLSGGDLI